MFKTHGISDGNGQKLLTLVKRKLENDFISTIMESANRASRRGVYVNVGTLCDESGFYGPVLAIPFMKVQSLDNEQAIRSTGVTYSAIHGRRNCRVCDLPSEYFYPLFGKRAIESTEVVAQPKVRIRESQFIEIIGSLSQDYFLGRMSTLKGRPISDEERIVESLRKQYSIAVFRNPLYANYRIWEKYTRVGLHVLSIIDRLHTVLLGAVAYVFRWSMVMTILTEDVRTHCQLEQIEDPVGILDSRGKQLQVRQAFNPCSTSNDKKASVLKEGFSYGFKNTEKVPDAMRQGVLTGGNIDGSTMLELLYGFLLSIGSNGIIVPNMDIKFKEKDSPLRIINPTKAIWEAGWSVIEMSLMLAGNQFSETADLDKLEKLIAYVIEKVTYLYYVKQTMGFFEGTNIKTLNIGL